MLSASHDTAIRSCLYVSSFRVFPSTCTMQLVLDVNPVFQDLFSYEPHYLGLHNLKLENLKGTVARYHDLGQLPELV